jgi:hypothetical protein
MAAEAIAADAADLRQGADAGIALAIPALPEGEELEKPQEENSDLESSEDEDEEPPKPAPPPPVLARMYAIPRDYNRVVEIHAECEHLNSKSVDCIKSGPDYGDKNAVSKFIYAAKATKDDIFYSVPYDGRKVLSINITTGVVAESGKTFKKDGGKYTEAVCSTNSQGRMYAAPCRAQRVLEIDSQAGTIKEVGPVLGSKKNNKWWAMAVSCGGRIYAAPYDAPRVLEINPLQGGEAKMVGPDLGNGKAKYACMAEAPNGNLYCAPLNARQVLEIDTSGKVRLVGPDLGPTERKYACIVLAPNRLLYSPPLYADRVLEINCARGDTREIGEILGAGEAKYACAAVARSNGKVYCAPLEARRVLEIEPDFHDCHLIGVDLGGADIEKYSAICAAPDPSTKLYAAPRNAHNFIEICPRRGFVKEVGNDHGRCPRKFAHIVPGNVWQGGMLREDYKVVLEKKAEEYKRRVARYEARQEQKAQEALMQKIEEALPGARRKSAGSNEGASRSPSKQKASRSPSRMPAALPDHLSIEAQEARAPSTPLGS